jgi:uncharacterized cupin superfamily protein
MLSIKNLLTAACVVLCSALIQIGSASESSVAAPPGKIEWLRVPDDLLSGIGIKDSLDLGKQAEHVGNQAAAAELRKVVFAGQLRTSVVQGAGDAIRLPSFPDDEVFCIIVGRLTLTADEDKVDQDFYAGDCVFVPKGWVGVWRQHAGVYREWATVPASYSFTESLKSNPPAKGARAFALEVPQAAGTHRVHTGSLIVEAENTARDSTRSITTETDETIHILRGNLTLKSASKSDIFKPGDIVILPKGLNAEMLVGAGYRAFIVRAK